MPKVGPPHTRVIPEMVIRGANCRAALSERLGLSKGAVTQLVTQLLDTDLVTEGDYISGSGPGRSTTSIHDCSCVSISAMKVRWPDLSTARR